MSMFLQTLLSGIVMGAIYGLVSMSLSMVYGVMKFTNFAHGALLSLGLYTTMTFVNMLGVDAYISTPLVIVTMFVFGYLLGMVVEKMLTMVVKKRIIDSRTGRASPSVKTRWRPAAWASMSAGIRSWRSTSALL